MNDKIPIRRRPHREMGEAYNEWTMTCFVCGIEQNTGESKRNLGYDYARNAGWRKWRTPGGEKWVCPEHARDPRSAYIEIWGGPPGKEDPPRTVEPTYLFNGSRGEA